jgi:hypothetical protein
MMFSPPAALFRQLLQLSVRPGQTGFSAFQLLPSGFLNNGSIFLQPALPAFCFIIEKIRRQGLNHGTPGDKTSRADVKPWKG